MATFAIIAEGITDQIVIQSILLGCLTEGEEEPEVNFVQPLLDSTGRSAAPAPGGWTLVLEYLRRGDHLKALEFNEYVVLQIDTDVCEDPGYDVPRQEQGRQLDPRELAGKVVEKLKGLIGAEVWASYGHRFLFAVAVDAIECWLLPLFFTNKKAAKATGCLQAVNHERHKSRLPPLSKADGKEKDPRAYDSASKPYRKRVTLLKHSPRNPSLEVFVEQVEALRPPAS